MSKSYRTLLTNPARVRSATHEIKLLQCELFSFIKLESNTIFKERTY